MTVACCRGTAGATRMRARGPATAPAGAIVTNTSHHPLLLPYGFSLAAALHDRQVEAVARLLAAVHTDAALPPLDPDASAPSALPAAPAGTGPTGHPAAPAAAATAVTTAPVATQRRGGPRPSPTNYLLQHSTGSGKSFTIAALAASLVGWRDAAGGEFGTVLVLNDRRQLDLQLAATVTAFARGGCYWVARCA